jgi:hypothetical protein
VRTGSRESDAGIGFGGVELTETTASLQLQVVHGGSCEGSPRLGFDWWSFWWSCGVTAEQRQTRESLRSKPVTGMPSSSGDPIGSDGIEDHSDELSNWVNLQLRRCCECP